MRRTRGSALTADAPAYDEEEEMEEEMEEEEEEEEEEMPPPPPRAPASRGKAPAPPEPAEDAYEDEEDEEDEDDVFDDDATVDDILRRMEGTSGPAPYEILAERKRQAAKANEEAFRQELARRGITAPADLSKEYGAAELLDRHMLDKEALLAANPAFKMFLGAAQGASVPRGSLGRGRSKKPRRTRKRVTEGEAERKLGEANLLYTQGESHYQRAIELLFEVIRLSPNTPDPWHTLATIHEELGDERKALDFLMIAVQLTPKDLDLWLRLAHKSRALGDPRCALTCFHKALLLDPEDDENRFAQAELYRDIGEPRRALEHLNVLLERLPDEPEVPKTLALTLHALGDSDAAEETLDAFVRRAPNKVTSDVVNILAQLKSLAGKYADAASLVQRMREPVRAYQRELAENERAESAERAGRDAYEEAMERGADEEEARRASRAAAEASLASTRDASDRHADIPVDLHVRLAVAQLRLGRVDEARHSLAKLRESPVREYEDLWLEAAETCADVGQPADAEVFYTALLDAPEYDTPDLWRKIAACIRARIEGSSEDAAFVAAASADAVIEFYRSALARHPSSLDAKLPLAEGLVSRGRSKEAAEVLPTAEELTTMKKTDAIRVLALRRQAGGDETFLEVALPMVRGALESDVATAGGASGGAATATATATAADASGTRGGKSARRGHASADADVGVGGRAAGRKRKEVAQAEGVFMGYAARDRRRPAKRARDEEEAAAAAAAAAEAEEEEDAAAMAGVGDGRLPSIGLEDEGAFQLTLSVAHAQFSSGKFQDALRLVDEVAERQRDVVALKFLRAHVCFAMGDAKGAADAAKDVTSAYPHSAEAWALHAASAAASGGVKKCLRSLARVITSDHPEFKSHPERLAPALLTSGALQLRQGNWGPALADLAHAYALAPDHPSTALAAGVAALHYAARSSGTSEELRHAWVLKAAALLQRAGRLSAATGHAQEGEYNLARGFHQLGLAHLARPLYERCLAADPPEGRDAANLRWEAAHNLARIYRSSGANALARRVLRQHAVV